MTERQLIQRARRGDPRAERAIYDGHVDRVFGLAYRMTGDQDLAEDLTQETFVRAFGSLDRFRGDAALSTWLHAIAMRTVISGLRKVRRLRDHEQTTDELPVAAARPAAETELQLVIEAALDAMPEELRTVFLLHDLEGFKHREIGEGLEISPGTSKSRLHRARAWLRDHLGRRGLDLAEESAS